MTEHEESPYAGPRHLSLEAYRALRDKAADRRRIASDWKGTLGAAVSAALDLPAPPSRFPAGGLPGVLATPVRRQPDDDPGCTAYAVAAAMESLQCRRVGGAAGVPFLSVEHIFERAGTDIDRAITAAEDWVIDEICRPFGSSHTCPDVGKHSWSGEFSAMQEDLGDMPDAMCRHLAAVGPLVLIIPMFHDWDSFAGSGIYRPTGSVEGGHAVIAVGYEQVGGVPAWIIKNSYGSQWGDGGYARLAWQDPDMKPEEIVFSANKVTPPI